MNVTEDRDELYDLTAAEVEPAQGAGRVTLLAFYVTALLLVLLSLFTIWDRTLTNWLDGNGFTPISHHGVGGVVPSVQDSEWAPGQRTVLVLPAEEARR